MPAIPPTVSYTNGQLTIVAPNSSLGDILRAVKAKTGANFDIPAGASERVVGKMGPGAPRDVLASLFNGTHFNYVMLGTANDPNAVSQIVLTPKSGGETPPAMQAAQPGMLQPGLQPGVVQPFPQAQAQGQAPVEEPQADATEDNNDDTSAQDENANGDQGAPEQVQGAEAQQQNPNQPNVKTPEQLLQELQRQQQIMQQQQQQGQNQQQPPVQQPQVIYTNPQQQQQPPQQPQ